MNIKLGVRDFIYVRACLLMTLESCTTQPVMLSLREHFIFPVRSLTLCLSRGIGGRVDTWGEIGIHLS
jgi:hypothetical protein